MMVGVMEKTFLQQQLRVCVGGWVGVADGDCGNEKKERNFIRIYFNNKKCVCVGGGGGGGEGDWICTGFVLSC